jgi:heat shock protein HspQ
LEKLRRFATAPKLYPAEGGVVKVEPIPGDGEERLGGEPRARFRVGDVVCHCLVGYRGVIVDVDPVHCGAEDWCGQVDRDRPPRSEPWYYVLVHERGHGTYVAEQHLEADLTGDPVMNRSLSTYFEGFKNGHYISRVSVH